MKPLTLILSESEFLASMELERVRAHWDKKGYTVEEVAPDDPQAVTYAIDTPSLFGDGRFVVVRGGARALEPIADRLAAWAASPPDAIAVAIVAERSAKLKKALAGKAELVEVASPKPWETADWLVRFVKGRGRVMAKEAAAALVDAIGTDLRDLATAAEQLTMATKGSIGLDAVHRMFRGHDAQLYVFLDAIVQRDKQAALRHLNALMSGGDFHPLALTATLANQLRALAAAKDAGRMPAAALAKEIGVTVGHVNRAFRHGRNFNAADLRRAFRLLADADDTLKGGERGNELPDTLLMELLVVELCGDPIHAGARR